NLTAGQIKSYGVILNNVGMLTLNSGNVLASIDFIRAAYQLNPQDEVVLSNYVDALVEVDRVAEARQLVEKNLSQNPHSMPLRAICARLLAKAGDMAAARRVQAEMFADGCTDEELLAVYLKLAVDAKAYDEAISTIDLVAQRKPTLQVQRFRATVYAMKGD